MFDLYSKIKNVREIIAFIIGLALGLSVVVTIHLTLVSDDSRVDNSSSEINNHYELVDNLTLPAHDFESEVAFRERIYQASLQQLISLLRHYDSFENSTESLLLLSIVLEKLTEEDPIRTLHEITNTSFVRRHELISMMFQQWARTHLGQALNQAQTLQEPWKYTAIKAIGVATSDLGDTKRRKIADKLDVPILFFDLHRSEAIVSRYLYADDPYTALDFALEDNIEDSLQGKLLHRIAQALVDLEGIEVVYDLYKSGVSWELRRELINELLANYARSNPTKAIELASSTLRHEMGVLSTSQMVRDIAIGAIAEKDPFQAMELVSEMQKLSHFERGELWVTAIKKWAEKNPQQLKESLHNVPHPVRFDALLYAAQHLEDDFEQALELSQRMIFHAVKKSFLTNVAKQRAQDDPHGTVEWIRDRPEFENFEQEVLGILVVELAANDPDLAMDLVQTHGVPTGLNSSNDLELNVVRNVAKTDAELALQMIPRLSVNSAADVYEEIGFAFLASKQTDRVLEIGKNLASDSQRTYYETMSRRWALIDPTGLYESVKKFPSKETRSKAALHLIRNEWQNELSQGQIRQLKRMLTQEDKKELRE